MNKTINHLKILCDQNARIDELFNTDGITIAIYERMNHALSMCGHLLDELQYPTDSPAYFERELTNLVTEVDALFDMMPTTIKYRGITAEISTCRHGYKCIITDIHGNDIDWFIRANTMLEAVTKAECHFDSAIHYLRGFIILPTFLRRLEEN